ncbi:halocyanin domain-containing protein [Halorarius halobius]|uniref:halocyanin domain-containing protein n=1 Tax=Halorarius halobius TaxID=2962671 RepID=UPI0020CC0307|nr:halocyanin domain-containing protein [Halorarius halobius]
MNATRHPRTVNRRRFLQAATLVAAGATGVAGTTGTAVAQSGEDLSAWFSNVSNFAGVVDERGKARVTVAVGADGNGGGFAFGPAAVRVDPGTTVVWEWTGAGGAHNVVSEDGAFESELVDDTGHTFEHGFESDGVALYACSPHKAMGMKGAVVVGDVAVATPTPTPAPEPDRAYVEREPDYGDWFDGVSNYEGTVDARGREAVTVVVGAAGNGGALAFDPPAVQVDPGTRVVWEWTGDGEHDVASDDGYASAVQSEGRFGQMFDGVGVSTYACTAHEAAGMRGAVVVGDVFEGVHELSNAELAVLGAFGVGILSPTAFGAFLAVRNRRNATADPAAGARDEESAARPR